MKPRVAELTLCTRTWQSVELFSRVKSAIFSIQEMCSGGKTMVSPMFLYTAYAGPGPVIPLPLLPKCLD